MTVNIILPNQLFKNTIFLNSSDSNILIEEELFFQQYKFHKTKIAFHRSTMQFYLDYLLDNSQEVEYIASTDANSDLRKLIASLSKKGVTKIRIYDPCDNWIEKKLNESAVQFGIALEVIDSPMYLANREDLKSFFKKDKKKFFQTTFYKQQRERFGILLDVDGKPQGGKWSFDDENRKKYPKGKTAPAIRFPEKNTYWDEAVGYVKQHFSNHYGEVSDYPMYPIDFSSTKDWLNDFFENRFNEFGKYEDAIVSEEHFLNHSVLTPMLNVGLITPAEIVNLTLDYARENEVPLNSLEGFIRQIIGWREFIRGVYVAKGTEERIKNFWEFSNKMPACFYDGSTGIKPIDQTILKLNVTAYSHHIERLMLLSNFMFLCEIDPDEVYQWFMEMYIDSYDWVMVPNVYGMGQFADGGLMSTKPYISSSNYVLKMSNYQKGEWQTVWDALFWRFIHKNRSFFTSNPRLSMMVRNLDKMEVSKLENHLMIAEKFLNQIHLND